MKINVVNIRKHKSTLNDFYCGRGKGSVLGNPFTHIKDKKTKAEFIVDTREESIEKHKEYFYKEIEINKDMQNEINKMLHKLSQTGEIFLCCFCAPKSCHCDNIKDHLLNRIEKSDCKICYDTGWHNGDRCVCVRKWDNH